MESQEYLERRIDGFMVFKSVVRHVQFPPLSLPKYIATEEKNEKTLMRSCVNGTHLRRFATQITQNDSPLSTDSWSRTVNVLACGRQHTPFSQSHVFHPRQIIKDISWLLAECLSPTSCYRRSIRHCLYFLDSPCILSPCLNFLWIFFSVHCSFSHLWCGICSMNVIQSLSASRKTSSVRAVTNGSVSLFSKTFWCRNS